MEEEEVKAAKNEFTKEERVRLGKQLNPVSHKESGYIFDEKRKVNS